MILSRTEKETIILYNENDDIASIYTCSRSLMNRLDKLCDEFPAEYQLNVSDDLSKSYHCPKSLISIRKPSKRKPMTEEQRREVGERFSRTRNKNDE